MAATLIGPPPAAQAVEEYRRRHPEAFAWKPSPGPTRVEAVRRGNEMINVVIDKPGSAANSRK
jgi:hypothetical protein